MIVTIAKVADFGQFMKTFSTKGAANRKSTGASAPRPSALAMTQAGCGWPSIGRSRTTRSSSPIPRSRRSPGTRSPRTARAR
jgi:hypothetical protein